MTRLLIGVIVVAALAGVGVGWWATLPPDVQPGAHQPNGGKPAPVDPVRRFALPANDAKGMSERPALAVDGRGRLLLAWSAETGPAERTLYLARSADGGATFSPPAAFRKVGVLRFAAKSKGKDITRSTGVLPRLSASGEALVLGWTEPTSDGRLEFLIAQSTDGGQTFDTPVKAHGGAAKRPGFTGMTVGPDGAAACVWLDARNGRQQPFCAVGPTGGAAFGTEQQVYAGPEEQGVCPCCDLDVLRTADGTTFVAFRDNDEDVREVRVSRLRAGATAFEPPVSVSTHGWEFPGCPHDGPALALDGGRLHVVWMDGHDGRQRVYRASSGLEELKFTSQPLDVKAPGQQGHPRLAAGGGALHAVWDGSVAEEAPPTRGEKHGQHGQPTGAGRAILYARWHSGGEGSPVARALAPLAGGFQLHPAVATGPAGEVFVAWLEVSESGRSVAVLRVAAAVPGAGS